MAAHSDRIEQELTIKAPLARVWTALSSATEFGAWFGAKFDGDFEPGVSVRARMESGECSNIEFEILIDSVEPPSRFAFRWHPHAVDPDGDYSAEPMTLVEFLLSEVADGTLVRIVESGFDRLPEDRREVAFRMNSGGWEHQARALTNYVTG